jgi:hypothetical protein
MLTPRSLPFFQGGRILRRVRSEIQRRLQAEPALRLQPGLSDLLMTSQLLVDPAAILAQPGGVALCGPPCSGRSLILLQIQARWAVAGTGAPVITLSLATDDAPNLSPRAVVAGAIHRAGLPTAYVEGGRPMLLLLDDWEDLPADRRALWRSYVFAAAGWVAARVVIGLPSDERWPGMTCIDLAPPDDDTLAAWLGQLLPGHDPAPIIAALQHEPLASLRASTGDLLLLTLIYPIAELPGSRAQLYEQAYALARPVLDETNGQLAVGRAALRHYRLARSLAGGADLAALTSLPDREIAAVAPLAAGLLGDPRPVLNLLWGDGSPDPTCLRGLVACLRERPTAAPEQHLRLIVHLASRNLRDLLTLAAPALPEVFVAVARDDAGQAISALRALTARWQGTEIESLLLDLIDSPSAAEPLRWAATDLLAARPEAPPDLANLPANPDPLARAARAYVITLAAPDWRARLCDPDLRPGLDALIAGVGGATRRAAVVAALAADQACPSELRVLALSGATTHSEGSSLLQRALADRDQSLRHSAMNAILAWPPDQALRLIGAVLAEVQTDDPILYDLLSIASQLPQREATGLIARCALREQSGLELRIAALRMLSLRPDGLILLPRFLAAEGMPVVLRAAAARLVGRSGLIAAIPQLRQILLGANPALLRRAAAAALADLACAPTGGEAAVSALIDTIIRPDPDATLTASVAAALGAAGSPAAIPALSVLLRPNRAAALRAGWLAALPALEGTPVALWPSIPLNPSMRAILFDAIAIGNTVDDQPSSLEELGNRQAEQLAEAAAAALADIAAQHPDLALELRSRIRQAIIATTGMRPSAGMFAALARAAGENLSAELETILDLPSSSPALRWSALEHLGGALADASWALERLRAARDDLFIRGKLTTIIGDLGDQRAVPDLGVIVTRPDGELRMRTCAAVALGKLGGNEAIQILLAVIKASEAPTPLRVIAVQALAHPLSDVVRHSLRQIAARAESGRPELSLAIGKAMARAGEREILPLLRNAAQSELADEAISAIGSIGDLGDPGAAPLLVRISQSAVAAPGVRLAAVAALLQIDGSGQLPLLRSYLNSPITPLRLKAYQILAQINPLDPQLIGPLFDPAAPLALRLASIAYVTSQRAGQNQLATIIRHATEPIQLRLSAAEALGRSANPEAPQVLLKVLTYDGQLLLHRRCCVALGQLVASGGEASAAAQASLASLAQATDTLAEIRQWAAELLLDHTLHRSIP